MPNPLYGDPHGRHNGGGVARSRWKCKICGKTLSSKRSYNEHMNVHDAKRPFNCKQCTYAAASQMTLHRHTLRNHVPRSSWGYHCPHCSEAYMEPASYQQHVLSRHPGLSATFKCPICVTFRTKSSRFFSEHYAKHTVSLSRKNVPPETHQLNVSHFLTDDDNASVRTYDVTAGGGCSLREPETFYSSHLFEDVDADYYKTPLATRRDRNQRIKVPQQIPSLHSHSENVDVEPEDIINDPGMSKWVESEVVIEDVEQKPCPPSSIQGFIDFDLD